MCEWKVVPLRQLWNQSICICRGSSRCVSESCRATKWTVVASERRGPRVSYRKHCSWFVCSGNIINCLLLFGIRRFDDLSVTQLDLNILYLQLLNCWNLPCFLFLTEYIWHYLVFWGPNDKSKMWPTDLFLILVFLYIPDSKLCVFRFRISQEPNRTLSHLFVNIYIFCNHRLGLPAI